MRELFFLTGASMIATLFIVLLTSVGFAQVMNSTSYQIQSDSVNFGGGYSSSTNYQLESTVGEIATGNSDSASYGLRAGYQQTLDSYIALSAPVDVILSPALPGVSGGTASGSTAVTVTTDNLGGYELSIKSETSPAMQSGANTIADYVPAGAIPDRTFVTDATDAHFGFSPLGSDVVQRYRDDGFDTCNLEFGFNTPDACWEGLSTTATVIASRPGSNHPAGAETVIEFKVGIGGSVVQPAGSYVATTTITAITL